MLLLYGVTMKATLLLALFTAASCASAGLTSDIEFAQVDGVSLKLDAWIPDGPGPFPTVILVHGGGWNHGDKTDTFRWIFEPLSKAGFAWFSPATRGPTRAAWHRAGTQMHIMVERVLPTRELRP